MYLEVFFRESFVGLGAPDHGGDVPLDQVPDNLLKGKRPQVGVLSLKDPMSTRCTSAPGMSFWMFDPKDSCEDIQQLGRTI